MPVKQILIYYARRNAGTRGSRGGVPSPSRVRERREQNPGLKRFLAYFGVRKLLIEKM